MGHRVAVLKEGVLQQVDTPRNLYDRPVNAFVAGFIGSPAMNLRPARLVPGGALLGEVVVPVPEQTLTAARGAGLESVTIGLRPESFEIDPDGPLRLRVILVEELGADTYVYGHLDGDDPGAKPLIVRQGGRAQPAIGDVLGLAVSVDAEHIFHPDTGARVA
jgi:multiple sugar transport system ATP-binding protein